VSKSKLDIASEREILRILVGSGLHGTAVDGQDDRDEMGIFIEPPDYVMGLKSLEHVIHRTQPEGERSGPGDLDLTLYSLRKWMRLALNGNPTILLPLFVDLNSEFVLKREEPLASSLQALKTSILSQRAGQAFLGYMRQQLGRLTGEQGGRRKPSRPELVEAHGFDTKYAMHVVRLGHQGRDLLREGDLQVPMPDDQREFCRQVRTGEIPFEDVLHEARVLENDMKTILEEGSSPLPKEPNLEKVGSWLTRTHAWEWKRTRQI